MWYCHFNFTAKQKGADDSSGKLFFAEVTHVQRRMAWKVSCFCKIDTEVNGIHTFLLNYLLNSHCSGYWYTYSLPQT
jgi:hypothetical protein